MKQTVLKGLAFLALLAVVLFVSNLVYARWFYHDDIIEADAKMLWEVDSLQDVSDVLYFAESSNATCAKNDTSFRWISQYLGDQVPGVTVNAIQHGAVHAATYLELLRNIRPGARTKTVIVTMNLRSFGAVWINSSLETPLMKANVMYKQYPPIIKRLMLAFNDFDNRDLSLRNHEIEQHWRHDFVNLPKDFPYHNIREWDNGTAVRYDDFKDSAGNFCLPKLELACNYIKIYGFTIDPKTNPRVADFDAIVRLAKEKHLNLIFNLLPENTQYADSLVGPVLVKLMRENRDFLVKRYNRDGVIVVDNLELVDGKDYVDQDAITEHYNAKGRMAVAKNIAKVAAKYLRRFSDAVDVSPRQALQTGRRDGYSFHGIRSGFSVSLL